MAKKYRETPIYKQAEKETPEWVNTATAAEIYIQMCERIVNAPTMTHMLIAPKILLPIIWKKIQEEQEEQTEAGQEVDVGTAEGGLQSAT